jgi:hypothetical protein
MAVTICVKDDRGLDSYLELRWYRDYFVLRIILKDFFYNKGE